MSNSGKELSPLFITGVPRSGSHIAAHVLGRHSRYFMIPREVRYHSNPEGLLGFLRGEFSGETLIERMRSFWWKRPAPWDPTQSVGLYKAIPRENFEAGLDAFSALHAADPVAAGRALMRAMFDPMASEAGKPVWIEHTSGNGLVAQSLLSMFPNARFVHMVRDGRDCASSFVALPWGPESMPAAIEAWEIRLREIDGALQSLAADRCLVMHLEDLVLLDRETSYRRLLDFLELDDEPEMRSFFATEVTAERAHVGRWRSELGPGEIPAVEALYAETLTRLRKRGVSCLPPERELAVSHPARESDAPNPFDPWADETRT